MTVPKLALWLLEHRIPVGEQEFVLGDLLERFGEMESTDGVAAARRWFWRETLSLTLRVWPGPSTATPQHEGDGLLRVLLRDLHFGFRTVRRAPLFSTIAVLTFGIGLGATGAIYSVVDPILLRGAPYPDASRLMLIWGKEKDGSQSNVGWLTFRDVQRESHSLNRVAAMSQWTPTLTATDGAERLSGQRVTQQFFSTLGVSPMLGRDFTVEEDHSATRRVAILSYGLWQRRFGGDSAIVGRTIQLSEYPYTVVGVMPASYESLLSPQAELWSPLGYEESDAWACRSCQHLRMIGKLNTGVSREAASAEIDRISAGMVQAHPTDYPAVGMLLTPINSYLTRSVRPVLYAIVAAVALLMLIACVNVANLFLGRAAERTSEFAVRAALGAGRGPLVRQLVSESLVLALVGGVVGSALAYAGIGVLLGLAPAGVPRIGRVTMNGGVLLFTMLVATLSGIVAGLAPAFAAGHVNLAGMLRQGSRNIRRGSHRLRSALVVAEVAVALVLLAGAGLLVRSLNRLLDVNPGFDPKGLVTLELQTFGRRYEEDQQIRQFYTEVLHRVAAVPGVEQVAEASQLPLSGDFDSWGIHLESRPNANPAEDPSAFRFGVSPGYIQTMGIPLIRGRDLSIDDRTESPSVLLINQSMAHRVFPGEDPLGQRVKIGGPDSPWRTIVGIVGDVRHQGLDAGEELQFYMPTAQTPWADDRLVLVVRSAGGDPASLVPAIRKAIHDIDPTIPIATVATMAEHISSTAATRRFARAIFEVFAAVALLLAALGLYGVLAGSVTERTGEIGVRTALGAPRYRILGLVVNHAMRLAGLGLALGIGGALLLSQLLSSLLFGITPSDPLTLGAVTLLLLTVSLAAAGLPAWRAARVDPMVALRGE